MRRRALLLAASLLATPAAAQDAFPSRAVTLVVPFAAGGTTDVLARVVAAGMAEALGRQVVVENRAGAGGNVGAAAVARAEPDGHTLLVGTVATHAINPALQPPGGLPYDPVASFAPVSLLATVPNVLVVAPGLDASDLPALVALLKAAPPEARAYASAGVGTPSHLAGALFATLAGLELTHVPYRGAGPALNDVLAGRVPLMFDNLPTSLGHIREGRLKALAVTTARRSQAAPDLPTMAEAGLPGLESYSWNALFAPAGTPPAVVARLAEAAGAAVRSPEVGARLAELSAEPVGTGPDELARHVAAELAKWRPVVEASGAKAQE